MPLYLPKRHKFHAKPTSRNGWHYPSQAQAAYYDNLVLLQRAGKVAFFLEEVPIRLPGKTKYVVDFVVFWADGTTEFIDVKGMKTTVYKLKKGQVEHLYPITITEAN